MIAAAATLGSCGAPEAPAPRPTPDIDNLTDAELESILPDNLREKLRARLNRARDADNTTDAGADASAPQRDLSDSERLDRIEARLGKLEAHMASPTRP